MANSITTLTAIPAHFRLGNPKGKITPVQVTFDGTAGDGGGIVLANTGTTLAVDSSTAASACAGTGTHNGTTAVTVSTTCAATGARIFFNDTSEPTTSSTCWVTNIVNGTSFDVDCKSAGQDATFAWWIQKEG